MKKKAVDKGHNIPDAVRGLAGRDIPVAVVDPVIKAVLVGIVIIIRTAGVVFPLWVCSILTKAVWRSFAGI
jgi:hypothetical protein